MYRHRWCLFAAMAGRSLVFLALNAPALVSGLEETLGCYHYQYGYHDTNSVASGTDTSATDCQLRCSVTEQCKGFTFWSTTGQCDLTSTALVLELAPSSSPAISGPPTCPAAPVPGCQTTELPGAGFPGDTAEASAAAWPNAEVPTNAQCWPRNNITGFPTLCNPQSVTILEDTNSGWHGGCLGLVETTMADESTCEESCLMDPLCAVWSEVLENTSDSQCWQGVMGNGCLNTANPGASRAQRIMHGSYRVLKTLVGMQVNGLELMFDTTTVTPETEAIKHCRYYCIGSLACQYWQYSNTSGCWVENPTDGETYRVAYPLTTANTNVGDAASDSMVAGEYVQHLCSSEATPAPAPVVATATAAPAVLTPTSQVGITALLSPVSKGAMAIQVESIAGFTVGDSILIGEGVGSETNSMTAATAITAVGGRRLQDQSTITLESALTYDHPAGCPVTLAPVTSSSSFGGEWYVWGLPLLLLALCGIICFAGIMAKQTKAAKDKKRALHKNSYESSGYAGDSLMESAPLTSNQQGLPLQSASSARDVMNQASPMSNYQMSPLPSAYQQQPPVGTTHFQFQQPAQAQALAYNPVTPLPTQQFQPYRGY